LLLVVALAGGLWFWQVKDVTVEADGRQQTRLTFEKTVADVLAEQHIRVGAHDRVEPGLQARVAKGTRITVQRAFATRVVADGRSVEIVSPPVPVREAVRMAGFRLGPADIVTPPPGSVTRPGRDIRVVRVVSRIEVTKQVIPCEVQRIADPTLERGLTRTLRRGQDGVVEQAVRTVYHDGVAVARSVLSRRTVRQAVPRVIAMGTITAVSRGGTRLEFSRALLAESTAYTYTGRRTASGLAPAVGLVAVDPSLIPMGSRLYVEGYGFARAADVGSAIKGNRIDVFLESRSQCLSWGRRTVKVYVLD
jgi:uncharacterized protein YabE (DUF348 family)